MRNSVPSLLLVLGSVLFALLIAEGAAQFYVSRIAGKPRLFQPDTLLGWRPISNLDITRRGPEGGNWRIQTNSFGWRTVRAATDSPLTSQNKMHTILLGDSYVFGQGVDVTQRFDAVWARLDSTLHPTNLGVMGYGTDQQLLALEQLRPSLKSGDRVILITHFNDLFDLLRREFSGRAKPWFEMDDHGKLTLHKPAMDISSWLRNHSYIYTRMAMLNEQRRGFPRQDLNRSVDLYTRLVQEYLGPARKQGVEIIIAFHGLAQYNRPKVEEQLENRINRLSVEYDFKPVKLDSVLQSNHYLCDGHWNTAGHRVVGETLYKVAK